MAQHNLELEVLGPYANQTVKQSLTFVLIISSLLYIGSIFLSTP